MTSGGHARSGPPPVPGSGASDRKGLRFKYLPAEGYSGPVPDFPLPQMRRYEWIIEDKKRYRQFDESATAIFRDTELRHWDWIWTTPQAALWVTPQWSWVVPAVADWCRLRAMVAEDDAPVALWAALRSREGDILLSNDHLNRAGYTVASDDVAAKRDDAELAGKPESARDRARRLRVVGNE